MQPAIKIASRIAKQASDTLRSALERAELSRQDTAANDAQLKSLENALYLQCKDGLKRAYKDHYIAPAGDGDGNDREASWHIFPILNGQNFLRSLNSCGVAILQKKRNRVENIALNNPLTGDQFLASRGYGSSLNGRRIRAGEFKSLEQSLIATDLPNGLKTEEQFRAWGGICKDLLDSGAEFRVSGSTVMDLAALACGKLDGVVLRQASPEEVLIGQLICQESGILMSDFSGNPSTENSRQFVGANPRLFKTLLQTLRPHQDQLT